MNDTNQNPTPPETASGFNRGKRAAFLVSLAMTGAVLWPIQQNWREKPHDSFPLSYYPMFSAKREAIETFYYLVGLDKDGKRYFIPHSLAGDGGHNAVRRQIAKMARGGKADEVAQAVAKRLAARQTGKWSKIVTVSLVTGRYAVDDYFHGKKDAVSEKIRATAQVERSTHESDQSNNS